MGARGKKRKRSDGTVANGKQGANFSLGERTEAPVNKVPVAALREIMPAILAGYGTIEEEIEDSNFYDDALDAISEKFDADYEALEYRATRLGWLVETQCPNLLTRHADGMIDIDDRLLEHVASCDVRDANAMKKWARNLAPSES